MFDEFEALKIVNRIIERIFCTRKAQTIITFSFRVYSFETLSDAVHSKLFKIFFRMFHLPSSRFDK